MSVPGDVIFGPGTTYKHVRDLDTLDDQILALRNRLEFFLIGKVEQDDLKKLAKEAGILYPQPYPLILLTCVAFETLGRVAFSSVEGEGFKLALAKSHQKFSYKLTKKFKDLLQSLMYESKDLDKIDNVADLVYTYFRNTMFHGYRTSAVFLNHEIDTLLSVEEGYVVINPQLVWDEFKELFKAIFDDLLSNPSSTYRKQCEKYVNKLLK